jgi:hypothetical protein
VTERRARPRKRYLAALGALTVAALGLRLVGLGAKDLWLDESMSALFASMSPAALVTALRSDAGPPLYYLLLGLVADETSSPTTLRALSVVCGALTVPATAWLARPLAGGRAALAAALVVGLSPAHLVVSQSARPYALWLLLCVLAAGAAWRTLTTERRHYAALTALAGVAALYTHMGATVVAVALCALVFFVDVPVRRARRLLAALAAAALAFVPWLVVVAEQSAAGAPTAWMGVFARGAVASTAASFSSWLPGGALPAYVRHDGPGWGPELAGAVALLCAALGGWTFVVRRRRAGVALGVLLLSPLVALGLLSVLFEDLWLVGRMDLFGLPVFAVVVGAGLVSWRRRPAGAVAVLVLAALVLVDGGRYLAREEQGSVAMADAAVEAAGDGGVVVATELTTAAVRVASARRGGAARVRAFPAAVAEHPGNWDPRAALADREALRRDAKAAVDEMMTAGTTGRAALIFVDHPVTRPLLEELYARQGELARVELVGRFVTSVRRTRAEVYRIELKAAPSSP